MRNITIEQLAAEMGEKVWAKGDLKRIYLNSVGYNTNKMTTKTFIFQNESGEFKVSCRIECASQPWQWVKSQEDSIKEGIYNDLEARLNDNEEAAEEAADDAPVVEAAPEAAALVTFDGNKNTIAFAVKMAEKKYGECGVFGTFVNERELREYWELGGGMDIMKRVFLSVAHGEVCGIHLDENRAFAKLLEEYDVASIEELVELLENKTGGEKTVTISAFCEDAGEDYIFWYADGKNELVSKKVAKFKESLKTGADFGFGIESRYFEMPYEAAKRLQGLQYYGGLDCGK